MCPNPYAEGELGAGVLSHKGHRNQVAGELEDQADDPPGLRKGHGDERQEGGDHQDVVERLPGPGRRRDNDVSSAFAASVKDNEARGRDARRVFGTRGVAVAGLCGTTERGRPLVLNDLFFRRHAPAAAHRFLARISRAGDCTFAPAGRMCPSPFSEEIGLKKEGRSTDGGGFACVLDADRSICRCPTHQTPGEYDSEWREQSPAGQPPVVAMRREGVIPDELVIGRNQPLVVWKEGVARDDREWAKESTRRSFSQLRPRLVREADDPHPIPGEKVDRLVGELPDLRLFRDRVPKPKPPISRL